MIKNIFVNILFAMIVILFSACASESGSDDDDGRPNVNKADDQSLLEANFSLSVENIQLASGVKSVINVSAKLNDGSKVTDVLDKVSCVLSSYSDIKVLNLDNETCEITTMFPGNATIDVRWREDNSVNLRSTPITVYVSPQLLAELDVNGEFSQNLTTHIDAIYAIYRINGAVSGTNYKITLKNNLSERLALQTLNQLEGEYLLGCQNSLPTNYNQLACGIKTLSDYFFVVVVDVNQTGMTPLLNDSVLDIRQDGDVLRNDGDNLNPTELFLDVEHDGHVSVNENGGNQSYYRINLENSATTEYEVVLSAFDFPISLEVEYDNLICTNQQLQLIENSRRCVVPSQQSYINIIVNGNNALAGDVVFESPAATQGEASYKLIVKSLNP